MFEISNITSAVEGVGSPNSDDWRKSLAVLALCFLGRIGRYIPSNHFKTNLQPF